MITLDSNPATDKELKSLIKQAIEKYGFSDARKKLDAIYKCALRRKHAEHIDFAEKALTYHGQLIIESKRAAFDAKFPNLTSILNKK